MAQAQTAVDLRTQARNVDFSLAGSTRPVKTGTALPGVCASGEMYFLSSAPSGQNLYGCTAPNTWAQLSGGTGGSGLSSLGGQTGPVQTFGNDANVTISSAGDTHTLGWSGTLAVSRGGTGQGSFVNGDLLYASGAAALSRLGIGFNGQCLLVSGGIPAWGACPTDPNAALKTSANIFSAGAKQTFQPSATSAGANIAAALLPSSPTVGDLAVDLSDGNTLKQYDGTAWRAMVSAASALTGGAILQGGGNNQVTTISSTGTGNVVRANSPVINSPTIASFSGANHDHGNTANGGAISNNALPDAFDISGKASTKSVKTGTTAPGNCAIGELFYDTDAAAGLNLYGCTSANVWTLLGDGGGGGGGITSFAGQTGASQTFANDTNVTITSAANTHALGWSGALSKLRQNTATVYSDQGNTWSTGAQDFSTVTSFRAKVSASDPPACTIGELFFHTVENVQKVCNQPNVWTPVRAVAPGTGVTLAHSGSTTTVSADTAVMLSQATNQANTSKYCADTGSTDTYTCNVTPALTTYTAGMFDIFRPNTNNTGATTKNISALGARNIKLSDGTTDPPDNTLVGGRFYATIYDGSAWRTTQSIVSSGNVSGVLPAGNGGTGLNSSASTGVPRLTSGTWSFDAGLSHLASSTSASLAGLLSDESGSGVVVFNNSPTIVSPVIASFLNATHTHADATGGGQLNASNVFSAGTIPSARLGSGTASVSTFLRGDQTWTALPTAVPSPSANGIPVCTGANCSSSTVRSITGTANEITTTNGDGVSGNPTLALASTFDISGKASTKPVKTGLTAPATCSVGELFYDTDATAGQNLYGCTSPNTWTQLGGSGGGGSGTVNSGTAGCIAFYPSAGSTVDDTRNSGTCAIQFDGAQNTTTYYDTSGNPTLRIDGDDGSITILTSTPWLHTGAQQSSDPTAPANAGEVSLYFLNGRPKFRANGGAATDIATGDATGAATLAPAEAYDATGWNGDVAPPQKDAVRDRLEALLPGGVLADASLATKHKTRQAHFKVWGTGGSSVLQDADDELAIWANQMGSGLTITAVTCKSDTGTPTIQLQRDDGSPTNMLSANLTCGTTPGSTTAFVSGENAISNGHYVDFLVASAGGAAHWVAVTITYTVD